MTEETKDYMPTAEEYYKQFEIAVLRAYDFAIKGDEMFGAKKIVVYAARQNVTPLLAALAKAAWKDAFQVDIPADKARHAASAVIEALSHFGKAELVEIVQKPYPSCDGEYVDYEFNTSVKTRFFYDLTPCDQGQAAFSRLRREGGHL